LRGFYRVGQGVVGGIEWPSGIGCLDPEAAVATAQGEGSAEAPCSSALAAISTTQMRAPKVVRSAMPLYYDSSVTPAEPKRRLRSKSCFCSHRYVALATLMLGFGGRIAPGG
jgi:hypothetical protein